MANATKPCLLLRRGDERWVPNDRGLLIGRESPADILLIDPSVSRRHAFVALKDQILWIEDLGSTNGTDVNGERITKRRLEPGDEITIGAVRLLVRLEPSSANPSAPVTGEVAIPAPATYSIGQQQAEEISNVARDQYRYDQSYHESNLASVIEKEGRGRRLMIAGIVLVLLGIAVAGAAILGVQGGILQAIQAGTLPAIASRLFPLFPIGAGLELLGIALFVAGLFTKRDAQRERRR